MLSRPRLAILSAIALAGLIGGGVLVAQMEAGDRGILPVDSSGTLEISGIHVDVGGKSAEEARLAGWRVAQREGFKALWAKSHNLPIGRAPNLSDSTLDGLVSSIVVEREQLGPNRYIADLGILFDRARAGELLGIGGLARHSAPMLLVPIFLTSATATTVETRNPWQRAWASFRTSQSPIDYIRVSGLGVDPLLVNAAETQRPGRGWWRNILDLYGAADILVAEVRVHRLYPGGPARATFTGRHGPDGQVLGSFELTAKDSVELTQMMNEGVRRMDQMFADALASGALVRDPSLVIQEAPPPVEEEIAKPVEAVAPTAVLTVQLLSTDAGTVQAALDTIHAIPGVITIQVSPAAFGNTSVFYVRFKGDIADLGFALATRGWNAESSGNLVRISRGSGAAPAKPPETKPSEPKPAEAKPAPTPASPGAKP